MERISGLQIKLMQAALSYKSKEKYRDVREAN